MTEKDRKKSILKIVLKTKNEAGLIEDWILYHSKIVGFENLLVLDHNSNSKKVLSIYKKYKDKLEIIKIPEAIKPDELHNTYINDHIFHKIKKDSLFFTFLDTDEFLCILENNELRTEGFLNKLKEYSNYESISTIWIHNSFHKKTSKDPKKVTEFNISPDQISHNILNGKAIFRHDKKQQVITHNKAVENHTITTDFILLHLKNRDIKDRMKTKKNFCISNNLIKKNMNKKEMIENLDRIPLYERSHHENELLNYLINGEKYCEKIYDLDENNLLKTNIINETIKEGAPETKIKSIENELLKEIIKNHFIESKGDWKKEGVKFIN